MKENLLKFWERSLKNFFEAFFNLTLFLPYFFSITTLFKTLFSPWKNLVAKKTDRGFSLNEWVNRKGFNLISSLIGFSMRSSIIIFYFCFQILFFVATPLFFVIYFIFLPFLFIEVQFEKSEEEKKKLLKEKFISTHLIKPENTAAVEAWFEAHYQKQHQQKLWWKVANLFSFPPLARDWAVGYTPTLDEYAQDLDSSEYQKKIKNIVDREKEIGEIERILSKSDEANVIVVGEEGVGKHTIIDALAKKIYEGKTNNQLTYKRILKLNMEKILNQYTDQKQREFFLEELFKEAMEAKNIVLMIDDFDKYVHSGEGIDLTIPLEKYGKSPYLQIIGITSPFLYQKFVFNNDKINRLFTKVDVYEVTKEEAEKILLDKAFIFEKRHRVNIAYETIKNTIEKSDFYITYIPFPEKAIDLLDNACVYGQQVEKKALIIPEMVDKVLSDKTHVPTSLSTEMKEKLVGLETLLMSRIIHQTEAVTKLSTALRRSFVLMGKRKKPLASFLFLGPTGVGKTETAKAIAKVFFGSESYLIRFDMANYQTKENIPALIGDIINNNPGLLTKAIRENPYGVLLLDELEKADKDLLNIFLTILDEGYFTDGFGKRVDCKNLVIIATSNAASDIIYLNNDPNIQSLNLMNYLVENHIFSPELLNRFDDVILYQTLNEQAILEIAKKMLAFINDNIYKLYQVKVNVSPNLLEQLIQKGYDKKFGARNLERVIRDEIEDKVAKLVLENKVKEGEVINL